MDAMVTARMPQGKKEVGNTILKNMGVNPSQAINDFYDYIIKNKTLPFEKEKKRVFEQAEILEAIAFVDSISEAVPSRFKVMTEDEIKQERLVSRGLATKGDFL